MPNYNAGANSSATRYKAIDTNEKLGKVIGTRYPLSVGLVLSGIVSSDRQALIRRYVLEGLQRDGLLPVKSVQAGES